MCPICVIFMHFLYDSKMLTQVGKQAIASYSTIYQLLKDNTGGFYAILNCSIWLVNRDRNLSQKTCNIW